MGYRRMGRHMIDEDDLRVSKFGQAAPAWLINYADLMTELVVLFVVLWAMSAALNKKVQKASNEIKQLMEAEKIAGEVKVEREGLRIMMQEGKEGAFFQSGKADVSERMKEILVKLGPVLRKLATEGQQVIVEGHTDNVPIRSKVFETNWELSTARATHVVRTLVQDYDLPPSPLAAIGYGEHRPVAPNDTPEGRSRNRRVVFFIKPVPKEKKYEERAAIEKPGTGPAEEPAVEAAPGLPSAGPPTPEAVPVPESP